MKLFLFYFFLTIKNLYFRKNRTGGPLTSSPFSSSNETTKSTYGSLIGPSKSRSLPKKKKWKRVSKKQKTERKKNQKTKSKKRNWRFSLFCFFSFFLLKKHSLCCLFLFVSSLLFLCFRSFSVALLLSQFCSIQRHKAALLSFLFVSSSLLLLFFSSFFSYFCFNLALSAGNKDM